MSESTFMTFSECAFFSGAAVAALPRRDHRDAQGLKRREVALLDGREDRSLDLGPRGIPNNVAAIVLVEVALVVEEGELVDQRSVLAADGRLVDEVRVRADQRLEPVCAKRVRS
jgi:hypothetical protein